MKLISLKKGFGVFVLFLANMSFAQQQPDTLFDVGITTPRFNSNYSPRIAIDGMHHNLHKVDGNFAPFAMLAKKDGYTVTGLDTWDSLDQTDVLVIANALDEKNIGHWQRPIYPAFAKAEIQKIVEFVQNGGSLLLIADHMPFAGASKELAAAFGFHFCDGFATLAEKERNQDIFSIANGRLQESTLTNGNLGVKIESIVSFTGSSFSKPMDAVGVLQFIANDQCLRPEIAWQFEQNTDVLDIAGDYQGALLQFGKGKIAVFGEAAMFTAQTIKQGDHTFKVGFNAAYATQNTDFVRNILYWLSVDVN